MAQPNQASPRNFDDDSEKLRAFDRARAYEAAHAVRPVGNMPQPGRNEKVGSAAGTGDEVSPAQENTLEQELAVQHQQEAVAAQNAVREREEKKKKADAAGGKKLSLPQKLSKSLFNMREVTHRWEQNAWLVFIGGSPTVLASLGAYLYISLHYTGYYLLQAKKVFSRPSFDLHLLPGDRGEKMDGAHWMALIVFGLGTVLIAVIIAIIIIMIIHIKSILDTLTFGYL